MRKNKLLICVTAAIMVILTGCQQPQMAGNVHITQGDLARVRDTDNEDYANKAAAIEGLTAVDPTDATGDYANKHQKNH